MSEGVARKSGAEIDVIKWFREKRPFSGITSFIHDWPDFNGPGIESERVGDYIKAPGGFGGPSADRYHVSSVEWTVKRYLSRLDGKETFRTSKDVSGRPEFIILSVLSSDYELKHLGGDGKLPQTMHVDCVWER